MTNLLWFPENALPDDFLLANHSRRQEFLARAKLFVNLLSLSQPQVILAWLIFKE
jgi:hypothetical protein